MPATTLVWWSMQLLHDAVPGTSLNFPALQSLQANE
jgi:hypothetical protein